MTGIRVVRYTTTPEARDENARLVSQVYAALAEAQPDGLRYATLLLAGEDTFIHVAKHADDNPLLQLPAFQRFQSGLADRLTGSVEARSAELVGSYRLL